jgi:hypothetical protein
MALLEFLQIGAISCLVRCKTVESKRLADIKYELGDNADKDLELD